MTVGDLAEGVRSGDRTALGKAITLVESRHVDHHAGARALIRELLPASGNAQRVGITGMPGVGKSTFIEALGTRLTAAGHRVAVLAVDPSSSRSGGSILGDKTRMPGLAVDDAAFIRPSPASGTLGGVARTTRETMLVCESAGYDIVLVETVGVGQSETQVAEMVDFFLVLMLPGGGDELQGIKKGVLELADLIAVNKADGGNEPAAMQTARDYAAALHMLTPTSPSWRPSVLTCSAVTGQGLDAVWEQVEEHRAVMTASGEREARRRMQRTRWMWAMVEEQLVAAALRHPRLVGEVEAIEAAVESGELAPTEAADRLVAPFV